MAMLVVTIIWAVGCLFGFLFGYVVSLDDGYAINESGSRVINGEVFNSMGVQLLAAYRGIVIVLGVTILYIPVMIALTTVWWATKPSR